MLVAFRHNHHKGCTKSADLYEKKKKTSRKVIRIEKYSVINIYVAKTALPIILQLANNYGPDCLVCPV